MSIEDYKTILYRQEDDSWVAEIPAIPSCYALMPTREEALPELASVRRRLLRMEIDYQERKPSLDEFLDPSLTVSPEQAVAAMEAAQGAPSWLKRRLSQPEGQHGSH